MFRLRCACLLLCADASVGAAQAQLLRGRWVEGPVPTFGSLDFRTGDTVWLLVALTAPVLNGRGTYRYGHGQLVLRYAGGSEDSARVTVRGDTIETAVDGGQTWTATRIAAVRGRRAPLQGTWAERGQEDYLAVTTYLPDGVFFTERAFVGRYSVDTAIVTIDMKTSGRPWRLRIEVQGADTTLTTALGGPDARVFRRPRCEDPRFDPRTTFSSVCS